jgi:hypothetical protein
VALSLYETCTGEQAVKEFGDPAGAEFFCERRFAVFPRATLCFATMGDPDVGTRLLTPSTVDWVPARLDYHPECAERAWLPGRLTEVVERNGAWLPLHHMFLRPVGDECYVYAGIAELRSFGDNPRGGRVQQSAEFLLDSKLPRDLWLRLGGYPGRLVTVNGTESRFAADDAVRFEQLLADVLAGPGYCEVSLAGYEEHWFTVQFNAKRAWLCFVPDAERRMRAQFPNCTAMESWDPDCPTPRKLELFGDDGHRELVYTADRTVSRELGVRAAVEHFRTGQLPDCIRWRERPDRLVRRSDSAK